ncbi:hypothetical protein DV736_g1325, partial [Chaetothyriales sp. CBS 134916]
MRLLTRPTHLHGPQNPKDDFPTRHLFVLGTANPRANTLRQALTENQNSMYTGMLITANAFAEFSTGMLWGRVSDVLGRKPVLIMGLIGTAISMLSFGFSTSLPAVILSRALGGLLNGNVGVLQTTVAELVTKEEHQPRAYSIMPFVWCLGSIIGLAMGGALAVPCESYPWLFCKGALFDKYPFLLPNLVCVVILAFGICIGLLFLEETHGEEKNRRDIGLETGIFIPSEITGKPASPTNTEKAPGKIDLEVINIQEEILDSLTIWYGDLSTRLEDGYENGIVAASHVKSYQPLLSGQIFEVKFDGKDSKEDAEKMKDMVDLQWALIVMASIAGAADPPELDDSADDDSDYGAMEVDLGTLYDDGGVQQWLERAEAAAPPGPSTPGKLPDISPSPPPQQDPTEDSPTLGTVTNLPRRDRTSPGKHQSAQPPETHGPKTGENIQDA